MSQYYRNHPDEPILHDWITPNAERDADLAARRADYLRDLEIEKHAEKARLTAKEHSAFPKGRW